MSELARCYIDFNNLLKENTKETIEDIFYKWVYNRSRIDDKQKEYETNVYHSANLDLIKKVNCLLGCQILVNSKKYNNPILADGNKANTHLEYWISYFKDYYFPLWVQEGILLEYNSPTYTKYSIGHIINLHDLTTSKELKNVITMYLDIYFASLNIESINGVNGSAKIRAYKDEYYLKEIYDSQTVYNTIFFGTNKDIVTGIHPAFLSAVLTDYVPSNIVYKINKSKIDLGNYSYIKKVNGSGTTNISKDGYIIKFPSNQVVNTYMTKNYTLSSITVKRDEETTKLNMQNRWIGSIIKDNNNKFLRAFPTVDGILGKERTSYNDVSGIVNKSAMIFQRLAGIYENVEKGDFKFYLSQELYDNKLIKDTWLFTKTNDESVYIGLKPSKGQIKSFEKEPLGGYYIRYTMSNSPFVMQMGDNKEFNSFEDFQNKVKSNYFGWTDNKNGDETFEFKYVTNDNNEILWNTKINILPKINGKTININSKYSYQSPFIKTTMGIEKTNNGIKYYKNNTIILTDGFSEVYYDFNRKIKY